MKALWILVIALAIAVVVLGMLLVGETESVNVEAERAALRNADAAWSQSVGNLPEFMSFVADGASVFPFHAPIVSGKDAARAFFSELQAAPGFALDWTATQAEVSHAGDLGYTTGSFQLTVTGPAGTPETSAGKYVTVWKKQTDGQWKVVVDIFNLDASPPQQRLLLQSSDAALLRRLNL
jgi:ketosteroid isomerase-like protein